MAKKKSVVKKSVAPKKKSKKKSQQKPKRKIVKKAAVKTAELKLTDVPIKSPDVISRQQGDVINVIHLQSPDEIYDIDGLAARAWELIDGVKNIAKISQEIAELGDFDKNRVILAFTEFLKDAIEQNLLSIK